jgi:uncharacterized protein (TIGR02217 family)
MNPAYLDFIEERLELGIDYGVVGGQSFKTEIIETSDGREQRNSLWWLPLGRWQLGDRMVAESQRESMAEVTYLKQFHADRKGSKQGFRFRDWADYYVVGQEIGIGDGIQTQWQLKKTYRAGNYSCDRPIIKPVLGTSNIYFDGENAPSIWVVDSNSGVVSFDVAPAMDTIITADFEFDVPVCFETDEIGFNLQGYEDLGDGEFDAIYRLESLFVKEIGINPDLPWVYPPIPTELESVLDLGVVYETIEAIQYSTTQEELASGMIRKDSNFLFPNYLYKLGNRSLNKAELDELLGFFWCAKGRGVKFNLKSLEENKKVYFDSDSLSLKFNAKEDNEFFFSANSLTFKQNNYQQKVFPSYLINTGQAGWSGLLTATSIAWIGNSQTSKWISYDPQLDNYWILGENFYYEIIYNFISDYPWRKIKGRLLVDNQVVRITTNGVVNGEKISGYNNWKNFEITNIKVGNNQIKFLIVNWQGIPTTVNPSGLRVEWLSAF